MERYHKTGYTNRLEDLYQQMMKIMDGGSLVIVE